MKRRKKIEKSFYAEREYYYCIQNKKRIRAIYYWIKWKFYERRIK